LARALTRFEMIGKTQSNDISELKTTVAKLGELSAHYDAEYRAKGCASGCCRLAMYRH
jgi:hypothetical protein